MENAECMLTTTDNPWNPFTNFEEWFAYDSSKGYGTCSYLARIANTSDELSDSDNDFETECAIDEIVAHDLISLITDGKVHYKKIYSDEKQINSEEEKKEKDTDTEGHK